jgi:hypothetical protein
MYPIQDLTLLAAHKAMLRRRISDRRHTCVAISRPWLQPVGWVDWALRQRHRLAPWIPVAMIPLALLLRRAPVSRSRLLVALLRWTPLLLRAIRPRAIARRY